MGHQNTSGGRHRPASPQPEDASGSTDEVGSWADVESYDCLAADLAEWEEWKARDAAALEHTARPLPPQADPYTLVSILQMHAGMFSNKGWGTFSLVYGKKSLPLDKMNERKFVTWRANDHRQVTYTSKAKDAKLSTGFLTDANEFDKMLDLIIQAKEHEGLLQQPFWQTWSDLVGPPPEEPLDTEGSMLFYLHACAKNNYYPSLREAEQAIRIPRSTIHRSQYWQAYCGLARAERDERKRSLRQGDVVPTPNQELDEDE